MIDLIDLSRLSVHPLLLPVPPLAVDAPEMAAIIEGVELHGVLRPVVINDRDEIMDDDGRCIVLAARKAGLKEVPCIVRPDADAASIILSTLCGRRHLTKSALAYLAFPLMEVGRDARLRRRTENLKSGASASKARTSMLSTFGETVESLADSLGFKKDLFYQAREVHGLFVNRPDLKTMLEPRLLLGELTLHTVRTVANNYSDTEGSLDKRALHGKLVADLFRRATFHFRQWEQLDLFQREKALEGVTATVSEWPEEVRKAIREAARNVKPQSI